jgi:hypothetical protein
MWDRTVAAGEGPLFSSPDGGGPLRSKDHVTIFGQCLEAAGLEKAHGLGPDSLNLGWRMDQAARSGGPEQARQALGVTQETADQLLRKAWMHGFDVAPEVSRAFEARVKLKGLALPVPLPLLFGVGRVGGATLREMIELAQEIEAKTVSISAQPLPEADSVSLDLSGFEARWRTPEQKLLLPRVAAWLVQNPVGVSHDPDAIRYPNGGLAALASEDGGTLVNVGLTNFANVLDALSRRIRVFIIPYPAESGCPVLQGVLCQRIGTGRMRREVEEWR